jgi:hypothetical protein
MKELSVYKVLAAEIKRTEDKTLEEKTQDLYTLILSITTGTDEDANPVEWTLP